MENKTIMKTASVKVMLSYNYNHFETSIVLENETGLTIKEIDDARKNCNRLCDKAILQYKQAKEIENMRVKIMSERLALEQEVKEIEKKDIKLWSVVDKAKIKALEDHNWKIKWDYDDDENNYL